MPTGGNAGTTGNSGTPIEVTLSGGGAGSGLPTLVQEEMCERVAEFQRIFGIEDGGASGVLYRLTPGTGAQEIIPTDVAISDDLNCLAYFAQAQKLVGREVGSGDFIEIDLGPWLAGGSAVVTNLGAATGLPAGVYVYGGRDARNGLYVVSGPSRPLYVIDLSSGSPVAREASFVPLGTGSGDIGFTPCGTFYALQGGELRRYESVADPAPVLVATVPSNGSGFSGAGLLQGRVFYSAFADAEQFAIDVITGEFTTGATIASGAPQLDYAGASEVASYRSFLRRYDVDAVGTVTFKDDIDPEGAPFTPVDASAVEYGPCPPPGDCEDPSQNDVSVILTTQIDAGSSPHVTSALARRVQSQHEAQPGGGRDTINGAPLADSGSSGNIFQWGDIASGGRLPPMTFTTAAGRDVFITEEI